MKIRYTWKHMDTSPASEEYANQKMEKMTKYVQNVISCDLSFEMIHGEIHANLNLHADHSNFHAHNSNKEIHACIDGLETKIERQLSKYHDKKATKPHSTV
jgi:putative sigma-54 modulation protein